MAKDPIKEPRHTPPPMAPEPSERYESPQGPIHRDPVRWGRQADPPQELPNRVESDAVGRLQMQKSTLVTDIRDAETRLAALRAQIVTVNDEVAEAAGRQKAEKEAAQSQLTALIEEHRTLLREHETTQGRLQASRVALAKTDKDAERRTAEMAAHKTLRGEVDAGRADVVRIQQSVELQEATLAETLAAIKAAEAKRRTIADEIAGAQKDLQTKQQAITERGHELDALSVQLQTEQEQLEARRKELDTVEAQIRKAHVAAEGRTREIKIAHDQLAITRQEQDRVATTQKQERQVLDKVADDLAQKRAGLATAQREHAERVQAHQEEEESLKARLATAGLREKAILEATRVLEEKEQKLLKRQKALQDTSLAMADVQARVKKLVRDHQLEGAGIQIPQIPKE